MDGLPHALRTLRRAMEARWGEEADGGPVSGWTSRSPAVRYPEAPVVPGGFTWPSALPGGRLRGVRLANRLPLAGPQELDGILQGMVDSRSVAELVRRTGAWEVPVRAE